MSAEPEFDKIDYLVRRQYNLSRGGDAGSTPRSREQFARDEKIWAQYVAEADAFRRELEQKSPEEIADLVRQAQEADAARAETEAAKREAAHPFNSVSFTAGKETYDYWAKAAYWNVEEAIALSIGRDPRKLTAKAVSGDRKSSRTGAGFTNLLELATRAIRAKQLRWINTPGFFIAWAKRNRIDVPAELEAAVRDHGHQVADWKTAYDKEKARADVAEAALEEHRSDTKTHSAPRSSTDGLTLKERESLLKMVIVMAVDGYGYDPAAARSPTAKEIASHMATFGLPLDEDTVRKYLKEARELLPPQDDEGR